MARYRDVFVLIAHDPLKGQPVYWCALDEWSPYMIDAARFAAEGYAIAQRKAVELSGGRLPVADVTVERVHQAVFEETDEVVLGEASEC